MFEFNSQNASILKLRNLKYYKLCKCQKPKPKPKEYYTFTTIVLIGQVTKKLMKK